MKKFNPKHTWWIGGLFWGMFMYLFMEVLMPMAQDTGPTGKQLLVGIPIWAVLGLTFGWITGKIERKWGKK